MRRDLAGHGMMFAEHGELAGIDAGRAIFAGLVDAQHRGDVGARLACPERRQAASKGPDARRRRRAHAARGFLRLSHRIASAPSIETIAFHPAMEMPSHDHCTSSQRTSGRLNTILQHVGGRAAERRGACVSSGQELELDAGMPEADRAADEDGERRQPDEQPAAIRHPAGQQHSGDGEGQGREMGPALPPAHLAGPEIVPDILRSHRRRRAGPAARTGRGPWLWRAASSAVRCQRRAAGRGLAAATRGACEGGPSRASVRIA